VIAADFVAVLPDNEYLICEFEVVFVHVIGNDCHFAFLFAFLYDVAKQLYVFQDGGSVEDEVVDVFV
jgi:hypothetical protein